jgi:hypothetical protein
VNIHVLARCTKCSTVYAFERGVARNSEKKCERVVSVSYGEDGLEYEKCNGDLELVHT